MATRRASTQVAPEQYFSTAMTLLAEHGASELKIGPMCRALGVTSGSFYHHFDGWAGFVRALLADWEAHTDRVVALARAGAAEPMERVELLKRLAVELPHRAEAAIRSWAALDVEVGHAQRRVDARRRAALEEILAEAVPDPAVAARMAVFGMALLVGFQQTHDPADVATLRALFDDYQDVIRRHAAGPG